MSIARGWSWRAKLSALLALFALIPLVGATWVFVDGQASLAERKTLATLQGLGRAKAEAIDQFVEFRRRDVERMAKLLGPFVEELRAAEAASQAKEGLDPEPPEETLPELEDGSTVSEDGGDAGSADGAPEPEPDPAPEPEPDPEPKPLAPVAEPDPEAETLAALRRAMGLIAWGQEDFEEILLLDPEGRVVLSTFQEHEDHSAADLRYFQQGRGGTYLEPLFNSPLTDELTMVIATPVLDVNHEFLGVIAARLNLSHFFLLLNDPTGLGRTGETVVGEIRDEQIVFMAPTRHRPDAALQTRAQVGDAQARNLQDAVGGQTGSGRATDYRGEPVLAAWQPVSSLQWGLLVKIDLAEALEPVREAQWLAATTAIFWTTIALGLALLISRYFVRPLRQLKDAADRISRDDFDVNLRIDSRDEIGELARSFERMVAAIKFFRQRSRRADDDEDLDEEPDAALPGEDDPP